MSSGSVCSYKEGNTEGKGYWKGDLDEDSRRSFV